MKRRLILSRCARRILYPLLGLYAGAFLIFSVCLFAMYRHAPLAPGEVRYHAGHIALADHGETTELDGDTFALNPYHGQYLVADNARIYLVPSAYFWPQYVLFPLLPVCATALTFSLIGLILSGHIRTESTERPSR